MNAPKNDGVIKLSGVIPCFNEETAPKKCLNLGSNRLSLCPKEIIDQGKTELLIPPGDVEAMLAAISRLLAIHQERQAMVKQLISEHEPSFLSNLLARIWPNCLNGQQYQSRKGIRGENSAMTIQLVSHQVDRCYEKWFVRSPEFVILHPLEGCW